VRNGRRNRNTWFAGQKRLDDSLAEFGGKEFDPHLGEKHTQGRIMAGSRKSERRNAPAELDTQVEKPSKKTKGQLEEKKRGNLEGLETQ